MDIVTIQTILFFTHCLKIFSVGYFSEWVGNYWNLNLNVTGVCKFFFSVTKEYGVRSISHITYLRRISLMLLFDRKSARDKPALVWEPALWLLRRKFSQWEMWDSWDQIYFQLNASQRLLQTVFCTGWQ